MFKKCNAIQVAATNLKGTDKEKFSFLVQDKRININAVIFSFLNNL